MSRNHLTSCLAVWVLVFLAGLPASAQKNSIGDLQLFAPANVGTFGNKHRPCEGFFFVFDGLMWSISAPETTPIGDPNDAGRLVWYTENPADTATQFNTHNTGYLGADIVGGWRCDLGCVVDRRGWLFSAFLLNPQSQTFDTWQMDMVWDDREWGGEENYTHLQGYVDEDLTVIRDLPVTFESARFQNKVQTWGLELSYLCRTRQMHNGGFFEFFAGARYLEFDDKFCGSAYGGYETEGDDDDDDDDDDEQPNLRTGVLADTFWQNDAKNHIVGPQLGARYFNRYGRWTVSAEGRFFAGFNSQSIHQEGTIGTELEPPGEQGEPLSMGTTSFNHHWNEPEWSPAVELRMMAEWKWTKSVKLRVGWAGLWIDGIARGSNMINYELGESSAMGILQQHNRQDVFINGLTAGISINR